VWLSGTCAGFGPCQVRLRPGTAVRSDCQFEKRGPAMPRDAALGSTGGRWPTLCAAESAVCRAQAPTPGQRRCGVFVPADGTAFRITYAPPCLEILLRRRVFCSVACIRAICLESIEILDSLDNPDSGLIAQQLQAFSDSLVGIVAAIKNRPAG
jgi:hypothetical protein